MAKKERQAFSLALLACLIWAGSFVIARGSAEYIPPFALAFWRWAIALIILLPIGYKSTRENFSLIKYHWKYFTCLGVLSVGVFNSLVYVAAHYTTTHHIALISSTTPIWTLLIAGFLGIDKLTYYKFTGAICAFLGALVIITQGNLDQTTTMIWNYGDILLLISALIWAVYSVMMQYKPKDIELTSLMLVMISIGTLFILPFYIWEMLQGSATPFNAKAISAYLYLGIGSSVIALFCWNYSIKTMGSVKTGLIYYTTPIFTSILAVLILGEPVKLYHWAGFILIFLGIIISNLTKLSRKNHKKI